MSGRRNVSSGGPWEERAGYSRAVVVGDTCHVSGTTDAGPDGRSRHPGDISGQADASLAIIEAALGEARFGLHDVVRTRIYLIDIARAGEVLEVHRRWFATVRPAATLVQVTALIDPSLLVEIEVDAQRAPERT